MCCEIKPKDIHPCSYIQPLVNKMFYNPETGEVFDENENLVGHGKPIVVRGEVTAIDVSPINHPLISK